MKAKTYSIKEFPEKHHGDRYYLITWQESVTTSYGISVRLGAISPMQKLLAEAGYGKVATE